MRPIPPIPKVLSDRSDWTVPSPEWEAWARATFVDPKSPLCNPRHGHLAAASIGFLLTNALDDSGGTRTHGTGGVCKPSGKPWAVAQRSQQLVEWFGHLPDFLLTLCSHSVLGASPRFVCALVDHELTHLGQAEDEHGAPRYGKDGRPLWTTAPHYAELVEDEVARWGPWNEGRERVVWEASKPPVIPDEALRTDG